MGEARRRRLFDLNYGKPSEDKRYLKFLEQVLRATADSEGDPQVVYPLLQANLDELDDNFAQVLRSWATATLSKSRPQQAQSTAGAIALLGILMNEFSLGNKASNQEIAIAGYEVVANFFPRDSAPEFWAETQNNLGNAYTSRINGERSQNLKIAISCYQNALQAIRIYFRRVQACINNGHLDKALEYVERSRSKRLVDLMASNNLYQGREIPSQVKELLQKYEDLQQRIDQERDRNQSDNNQEENRAALQAYNEIVATIESEKQQTWEQLRRLDPVLAGEIQVSAPDFAAMQQLIDQPTTAILSFYTTSNNTHIFVLRQNQVTCHTCPGQETETLPGWIKENWLLSYLPSEGETKQQKIERQAIWRSRMRPLLSELAGRLRLDDLIAQHLDGIEELILVPHRFLHQIPFTALPIQYPQNCYLGDEFLIRYTPSCQVLEFCKQRGEVKDSFTYGIVEDATDDLHLASYEGEQIANLYSIPNDRRLRGSSQATCFQLPAAS